MNVVTLFFELDSVDDSTSIPSDVELVKPRQVLMNILQNTAVTNPFTQNDIHSHPNDTKICSSCSHLNRLGFHQYPYI